MKQADSRQLERYTSAVTLSDMEVFVFPELMYSLVLANIMSPVIWQWRQFDCFKKIADKSPMKKLMRLRQFIMDEYDFNLDLETWGLTSKDREIARFEKYISAEQIAASNALFGYHGDEYYFDVDIRRHFGLDKYDSDIIPYWKTETVEAMDAFRFKKDYTKRAGECVSLAALYAAAAFVVCGIPLEDIYMMLTPLHSQNYIDIGDGVLTNNRRLVTRTMWFNGTEISNKAQRALRNEKVTIVAHCSGYIHCLYDDATIAADAYEHFMRRVISYLCTEVTFQVFANFLRSNQQYQKFFQICRDCRGHAQFLKAEVLFHYEHASNFRIADSTHEKLLAEVSDEDFSVHEFPGRLRCDQFDEFLKKESPDLRTEQARVKLTAYLQNVIPGAAKLVDDLAEFTCIEPKLPSERKNFAQTSPIRIPPKCSRDEIIEYLRGIRKSNATADLAFYAYRDMQSCDWTPFIKAAVQLNPVSIEMARQMSLPQCCQWLRQMRNTSIYDGKRLAQPDEVANFNMGDGLEKALLLANVIRARKPEQDITIMVHSNSVVLTCDTEYVFTSDKGFEKDIEISAENKF